MADARLLLSVIQISGDSYTDHAVATVRFARSQEQTRATAFDLIEDRKQQGWVFVFIGANQDVYQTGAGLSVSRGNSLRFEASGEGTTRMFTSWSESTAKYRTSTKEQRLGLAQTFFETKDPSEEEGDRRG